MTFYSPRNITPADQILFDANGDPVGIQPAGSSQPPLMGLTPTTKDAVQALVSAPWNRIGSTRPQSAQTNRNLIAALDLGHVASGWSYTDLTGGTFTASGGAGAYAAQASAYGNVPALLTVNAGSTGNTSRVAWSAGFEGDFMDRGAVFSMIIEVLSGMDSNNTVRLIFSSDGGATKTMTGTLTTTEPAAKSPQAAPCSPTRRPAGRSSAAPRRRTRTKSSTHAPVEAEESFSSRTFA